MVAKWEMDAGALRVIAAKQPSVGSYRIDMKQARATPANSAATATGDGSAPLGFLMGVQQSHDVPVVLYLSAFF
jgi:hypothetical protein